MRLKLVLTVCIMLCLLAGCATASPAPETTVPTTTVPVTTVHVHAYEVTETPATCEESGSVEYLCACGEGYSEELAPVGHAYSYITVAPTWEEQGYNEHTCSRCGNTYQDSFVECEKYATLPPSQSGEVLHFFDDAAFIGDSVSLKLQNYQMQYGTFGTATFLTAGSYSLRHAVNNSMYLTYRGEQMTPQDALAASGVKKVFILLGMNDVGYTGVEQALNDWAALLKNIRETCPDLEIYIQSGTPIFIGGEKIKLNNKNMDRYNELLVVFAEENNCHFVDIATTMKNEQGGLKAEFCSDRYVHLTNAACDAWALALKEYVNGLAEE